MVLRRFVALGALLSAACVTAHPAVRAPRRTAVATALVLDADDAGAVGDVPAALTDLVRAALDDRNLAADALPATAWSKDFAARRATQLRLQALAAAAPGAELVLLVETKATFYSLLNGRFRWSVRAKATLARRDALADAVSSDLDFPAFLDFEFQREPEVLTAAAATIADHVGRLADQFLGGMLTMGPSVGSPAPLAAARPSRVGPRDSIYFVMVDRFNNGDPSNDGDVDLGDPQAFHGGDLQGVLDKLDYIKSLGFTTVWLSPVFQMRTAKFDGHGAFHGYWVEDMSRVEPRFGDEKLLARLADALHQRGMKLILDVVLNHVANDAPLARAHPAWFHHHGGITDWDDRNQLENFDVHGLPDLAQENEEVYQYLLSNSLKWIDRVHPDGFRLDAVKHVPLAFWARYNDDVRRHAGADFFLLGEALDGDPDVLATTLRDGHFSSLFNFPLYFATIDVFCKGKQPGRIGAVLEAEGARRGPLPYVNLVDNHDLPRLLTACGGDVERAREALDFMLVSSGIPSASYGTEIGIVGQGEPENRADMRFGEPGALQGNLQAGFQRRSGAPIATALEFVTLGPTSLSYLHLWEKTGLLVAINTGTTNLEMSLPERLAASRPRRAGGGTVAAVDVGPARVMSLGLVFAGLPPADTSMASHVTMRIAALQPGTSSVRLVGLGDAFGRWKPDRGPEFRPHHGVLEATLPLAPGGIYQFKLVSRDGAGAFHWEDGEDRFFLNHGGYVDLAWNSPTTPVAG